jgi:inosose dehydratase
MTAVTVRIAAAPISWGILDVVGWGYQMAPDRVMAEMRELGFTATEFGSPGFLPDGAEEKAAVLKRHELTAVGSFLDVVLHDRDRDPLPVVRSVLEGYRASGAGTIVLAAATGANGFDAVKPVLDAAEWKTLLDNLRRARSLAAEFGVTAALHPHVGTMVETADEVSKVLAESDTPFCLDTGHLIIGGTDPVQFARDNAARISHVHLKDVDLSFAERVTSGAMSFHDGCRDSLFVPLGRGDVDIPTIVQSLASVGYDGWYVLEQDTVLAGEPDPGQGPALDSAECLAYLKSVVSALNSSDS